MLSGDIFLYSIIEKMLTSLLLCSVYNTKCILSVLSLFLGKSVVIFYSVKRGDAMGRPPASAAVYSKTSSCKYYFTFSLDDGFS